MAQRAGGKRRKGTGGAASNVGFGSSSGGDDLPLFAAASGGTKAVTGTVDPIASTPLETSWREMSISRNVPGTHVPPLMPQIEDDDYDDVVDVQPSRTLATGWASLADKTLQGDVPIGFPAIITVVFLTVAGLFWLVIQEAGRGQFDTVPGRLQCGGIALCVGSGSLLVVGLILAGMDIKSWKTKWGGAAAFWSAFACALFAGVFMLSR
jgi:hypothetical protein